MSTHDVLKKKMMGYRLELKLKGETIEKIARTHDGGEKLMAKIIPEALAVIEKKAKENLSGIPFSSKTGNHTIQKRTGRLVESVGTQYPYENPYKGRVFASAKTRYAFNPEEHDYAAILEFGRGEIKPKYTPSMMAGKYRSAALTIPGGGAQLTTGLNGFRGASGSYRFVKRIPPMEGKFWMESALQSTAEEVAAKALAAIDAYLDSLL
ncbi:MAG: hypothetical protein DDT26_01745 [Dehalococcoidia bacterium]|nr:hypothetical protein [Chloroflexota bacterium]